MHSVVAPWMNGVSIGSANTVSAAGEYWINSTRSVHNTTFPGVAAMSRPTMNFPHPLGRQLRAQCADQIGLVPAFRRFGNIGALARNLARACCASLR
jgi:hypothetical protein